MAKYNPLWKPPYESKVSDDDCNDDRNKGSNKEYESKLELNSDKTREFYNKYAKEDACEKYLFEKRWPDGYRCPKCGHDDYYESNRKSRVLYQCKKCKSEGSITSGTIFEKSQMPLDKWFKMIFLVTRRKEIETKYLLDHFRLPARKVYRIREKIEVNTLEDDAYDRFFGLIEERDLIAVKRRLSRDKPQLRKAFLKARTTAKEKRIQAEAKNKKILNDIVGKCNIDEMVKQLTS